MWLQDPAIYVPARETFGGAFHYSGTFDYADGRDERDPGEFPSIVDGATATGLGSLQNIHVLYGQSMAVEADLGAKLLQVRDLIDDIGGIPGPADTVALAGPIYHGSNHLLQVRCLKTVPCFRSLADAHLTSSAARQHDTHEGRPRT